MEIISAHRIGKYLYAKTDPVHPRANKRGLYPVHRLIMENELGRLLETEEVVHHINGNTLDNEPSNLKVMNYADHARYHSFKLRDERLGVENPPDVTIACAFCGKPITMSEGIYRYRLSHSKTIGICCSKSCSARKQYEGKPDVPHTAAGYHKGCRCRACKAKKNEYQHRYMLRKKQIEPASK